MKFVTMFCLFIISNFLFSQGWVQQTSGTANQLRSVFFIDQYNGWAVGRNIILKTTDGGKNWISKTTQISDINSIFFINENIGWAVGWNNTDSKGAILKTTNSGIDWIAQTSGTTSVLYSVHFVDQNIGWAVGGRFEVSTILKTTNGGGSWLIQTNTINSLLNSVYFLDQNNGWVTSEGGSIRTTTNGGTNWQQKFSVSFPLKAINFVNQNIGWAVGSNGTILKTTNGGTNWVAQTSGVTNLLCSVSFVDQNFGWVVGDGGIILNTTNSGTNWISQIISASNWYFSVYFINKYTGWAVGSNGIISKYNNKTISLNSLNNGGRYKQSNKLLIRWSSLNIVTLNIDYSTNNGSNWLRIGSNVPASDNTFLWTIPNTPSNQCKIKITDASDTLFNVFSDSTFTICQLNLTKPTNNEKLPSGKTYNIQWQSAFVDTLKIELSTNNGSSWSVITPKVAGSVGNYNWMVPNLLSKNCKIRLSSIITSDSISTQNDSTFQIFNLELLAPNNFVKWDVGKVYDIQWGCDTSVVKRINLYYSTNNGSSWISIINNVPSSPKLYSWKIPNAPSTQCIVKVEDTSGVFADISDSVFTIYYIQANPFALINPTNFGTNISIYPKFEWQSAFTRGTPGTYSILYGYDPNFIAGSYIRKDDLTNLFYYPELDLAKDSIVYWKVLAINSDSSETNASDVYQFQTLQSNIKLNGQTYNNRTLNKRNSPYLLEGNFTISKDNRLTIPAGITINASDTSQITVKGEIRSMGTLSDSIKFISQSNELNKWKGIKFDSAATDMTLNNDLTIQNGSAFYYTVISNTGYNNSNALDCSTQTNCKSILIENSDLSSNGKTGLVLGDSSRVSNCKITKNNIGIDGGYEIKNCNISDNTLKGINFNNANKKLIVQNCLIQNNGQGAYIVGKNIQLHNNQFIKNKFDGVVITSSSNIQTERNIFEGDTTDNTIKTIPNFSTENGLTISNSRDINLTNNLYYNNFASGLSLDNCRNIIIKKDTIQNNIWLGLYVNSGDTLLVDSNIIRNNGAITRNLKGGGIYLNTDHAKLNYNIIKDNSAISGGGVYINNFSPELFANVVYKNIITNAGGGINISGTGSPSLINNTISYNTSQTNEGAGIYISNNSTKRTRLSRNIINENLGFGIFGDPDSLINNNISLNKYANGQTGFAYKKLNALDMTATNNWWGSRDVTTIENDLFHKPDSSALGTITSQPFLSLPSTQTPDQITNVLQVKLFADSLLQQPFIDTIYYGSKIYLNLITTDPNIYSRSMAQIRVKNLRSNQSIEPIALETEIGSGVFMDSARTLNTTNFLINQIAANLGDSIIFYSPINQNIFAKVNVFKIIPPYLLYPENNIVGLMQDVQLKWSKIKSYKNFHLQVSTDSNFATYLVNDSTMIDTLKQLNNLSILTTYYWKLRTSNGYDWSEFSSARSFKIIGNPNSVNLVSPTNNAINQPLAINFVWNKPTEQTKLTVSKYWFELYKDTAGVAIAKDTTLSDTTKSINSLEYLTNYYWKVKAKNETGWGAFSNWFKFTTIIEKPTVPVCIAPTNNSIGLIQPIILKWTNSLRKENYVLQVSQDSAFANIIITDTLTDTTKSLNNLSHLTKYYWRVRGINIGGMSDWSIIFNFKTIGNPNVVTLLLPQINSVNQPLNVSFKWSRATEQTKKTINAYWFELYKDTAGVAVAKDTTLSDTTKSIDSLEYLTNYFWKVKAKNETGWGAFSNWFKFTTIIEKPTKVVLVSPVNDTTNQMINLTFKWNSALRVEKYIYQLAKDSNFTIIISIDSSLTDTTKSINNLEYLTNYYWRVKAKNIGGEGAWSNVSKFKTIYPAPIAPQLISPANYSQDQSDTVKYIWTKPQYTSTYTLHIATDSLFTNTFYKDTTITDTTKIITAHQELVQYFWRVKAKNISGESNWSQVFTFRLKLQCINVSVAHDWNIISVPLSANNMSKTNLFPTAISAAYGYNNGYKTYDTLSNGIGYWIKFPSGQNVNICGYGISTNVVQVKEGWNIIGGFSKPVPVFAITSTPSGIIVSPFYGFNTGYYQTDSLRAGKGYWVKVSQNGTLNLPSTLFAKPSLKGKKEE